MRLGISLIIVLFVLNSCKKEINYTHLQGNALGTTFSIKYKNNTNYSQSIDSLFSVINNSLSTYHSNSIISKINKGDSMVMTDFHFEKVYRKAKRIFTETNGAFDPTVGNLVNAWGFGPGKELKKLDSSSIKTLMKHIGFDKTKLSNHYINKEDKDLFFDFNAIAKGYAVDVIGVFFESKNIINYMVEIGGEIRVRGVNSNHKLWKVGIEKPLTDGTRAIETTLELNNQSMATSGNYRKFRIDENGKKYVHTINPKTGYTLQNDLLSASVISTLDCADVDAYATAFMVMGFEKTKAFLLKHPELDALLIYVEKDQNIHIFDSTDELTNLSSM
ncbi:MAG TPA: FAD:protein FMN transferase [Lutibacter sp.]|nr:FAD:protein FMN transferase [Lutibacter sp.]